MRTIVKTAMATVATAVVGGLVTQPVAWCAVATVLNADIAIRNRGH